jgi:hypothetical protein
MTRDLAARDEWGDVDDCGGGRNADSHLACRFFCGPSVAMFSAATGTGDRNRSMGLVEHSSEQLLSRRRSEEVAPSCGASRPRTRRARWVGVGRGVVLGALLVMLVVSEPVPRWVAVFAMLVSAVWVTACRAGSASLPSAVGPIARAAVGTGFALVMLSTAAGPLSPKDTAR